MKSKLTLIVDGNWLLMSRMLVLNTKFSSKYDDKASFAKQLKILLAQSVNIVTRHFKEIDNIIFVSDGGSWRSKIEIPKGMDHDSNGKNVEYKGTRIKSDDIDWDLIFGVYEEFINEISKTGITTCREKDIEGDDWCAYWSKKLNEEGTNCIIWSKDRDLQQLVSIDHNKCFTVIWNKEGGIIAQGYEESQLDFLFNNELGTNDTIFNSIISKVHKVTYLDNPMHIVIDKIFKGDVSDNILPLAMRGSKDPLKDKQYRISTKDVPLDIDIENDNEVRAFFEDLYVKKNYHGRIIEPIEDCIEHFYFNKRLVWLNKKVYPQEVIETLSKYTEYTIKNNLYDIEEKFRASQSNISGILDLI